MRKIISIILLLAFIILSISGVQMAVVPKPQNVQQQVVTTQNNDKQTARGEMPFYPKKAHEWAGYLFIGAGLVHIILNRRPMLAYFGLNKNGTNL